MVQFKFATGDGTDRITDFQDGSELIDLTSFGFADFAEFDAATTITSVAGNNGSAAQQIAFTGGDMLIADSDSGPVVLTSADFLF